MQCLNCDLVPYCLLDDDNICFAFVAVSANDGQEGSGPK